MAQAPTQQLFQEESGQHRTVEKRVDISSLSRYQTSVMAVASLFFKSFGSHIWMEMGKKKKVKCVTESNEENLGLTLGIQDEWI